METENGWDQALFNECIFFPNRPGYKVGVLALVALAMLALVVL